jgi:hypothetical protein
MRASNHHDDTIKKEVGTQGVNIAGHGRSRAKLSLGAKGGLPPPTEDKHTTEPSHPVATCQPGLPQPTTESLPRPKRREAPRIQSTPLPPPPSTMETSATTRMRCRHPQHGDCCAQPRVDWILSPANTERHHPTTRTTTPLHRGRHQSCHHRKTSVTLPHHHHHYLGMRCCRRGCQSCRSPITIAQISHR